MGADVWIGPAEHENIQTKPLPSRCTLLCQNLEGYRHLTRLISRAYLEGQKLGCPVIQKSWLENHTAGLIALSGAIEGDIGQAILAKKNDLALDIISQWKNLFPDRFYLEIQRIGKSSEEYYNQIIINLSLSEKLPLVATNNVRFLNSEDYDAHEARVCIHASRILNDPKRPKNYTAEQYLKTPQQMAELFSDLPAAIQNTVEIAKRCNLVLPLGKSFLPQFQIPCELNLSPEAYLSQQAAEGLAERLKNILPHQQSVPPEKYLPRLETELKVINQMGFAGYFLIVADFINWAKSQKIPVGPGRGSGAGSLAAYALGITDIDPLPYDLLFERFLNPERISMPDFDIDFCMDNRDRVIDYVALKYGRDSVSQIITFGTMAAKAVVRDVGRVLGHPYGFVDKIAKLIPFEIGMTLDKALKQESDLRERYHKEEEVKLLIDLAKKLEGLTRNAGKHAGGLVIAPSKLTDFTPLYCEEGEETQPVSQFDKNDIEDAGLVKFDFLGLRTLTIIGWAVDKINHNRKLQGELVLNIQHLPLDDEKAYQVIKTCQTTAVFQLESRGMKDLIKGLKPSHFEDIVSLVALFRPGPLQSGMVEDFINRKHGRAKIDYPHALLVPFLESTYGIILYQEQVVQIAQALSGYSLGQADLLRRAMGKKKADEMAKQREIFIQGAKKNNNIDKKLASDIFDLMEKFAEYGFNKSHSVAYALITYQTAWLKAHYPAEFMSAVLSSDMDKTDKVVNFLQEARRMNLVILPPDINASEFQFSVTEKGSIRFGLGALKGAGEAAISIILDNRQKEGKFLDFTDFFTRIDSRKVNRRVMEALIKSGSLDTLGLSRATMMANLEDVMQGSQKKSRQQKDLFSALEDHCIEYRQAPDWNARQTLQAEKEVIRFFIKAVIRCKRMKQNLELYYQINFLWDLLHSLKLCLPSAATAWLSSNWKTLEQTIEVTIFAELYDKKQTSFNQR